MKKVLFALTMSAACAWAQEPAKSEAENTAAEPSAPAVQQQQTAREAKAEKAAWPVWLSFNSTKNIDIVGFRFTVPYGACEGVTGFDLGIFGRCRYMEGFQLNILRTTTRPAARTCWVSRPVFGTRRSPSAARSLA